MRRVVVWCFARLVLELRACFGEAINKSTKTQLGAELMPNLGRSTASQAATPRSGNEREEIPTRLQRAVLLQLEGS